MFGYRSSCILHCAVKENKFRYWMHITLHRFSPYAQIFGPTFHLDYTLKYWIHITLHGCRLYDQIFGPTLQYTDLGSTLIYWTYIAILRWRILDLFCSTYIKLGTEKYTNIMIHRLWLIDLYCNTLIKNRLKHWTSIAINWPRHGAYNYYNSGKLDNSKVKPRKHWVLHSTQYE